MRMFLRRHLVCRLKGHRTEHHTLARGKVTAHSLWCARCDLVLTTWSDRPRRMAVPRGA